MVGDEFGSDAADDRVTNDGGSMNEEEAASGKDAITREYFDGGKEQSCSRAEQHRENE